jgi:polyisoprenyl-phosphate glycosyltransferase
MFSLVIPVYKNETNLDRLLRELIAFSERMPGKLEIVFVVDGSPDRCCEILKERLPDSPLQSQLLLLSRNFGAFSAIMAGLAAARGDYFAVLAADLQEPLSLAEEFFAQLEEDRADVIFGTREDRSDPVMSKFSSWLFWQTYRRFVLSDMPHGGIDVFGCNRVVRDRLLQFRESNTNLIALLFWIGYRRSFVPYTRAVRQGGKSAWSFRKKVRYCLDSIFNFTDLPLKLLLYCGLIGMLFSIIWGVAVLTAKLVGSIPVPGYAAIVIAILFFGGLTSLGLGIVGQYLWLTLQNVRQRPNYIVADATSYDGLATGEGAPGSSQLRTPVR